MRRVLRDHALAQGFFLLPRRGAYTGVADGALVATAIKVEGCGFAWGEGLVLE